MTDPLQSVEFKTLAYHSTLYQTESTGRNGAGLGINARGRRNDVKLPNAERALVERENITGYLLNPAYRYGASKARFLGAFGFRAEQWGILAQALREHGQNHTRHGHTEQFGVRRRVCHTCCCRHVISERGMFSRMVCDMCGKRGAVIRHVPRSSGQGATLFVIENVPIVSCPHCGESYLTAETLHEIERIKLHRKALAVERRVVVAGFV